MMSSRYDDNSIDKGKINELLRTDIFDFYTLAADQEERQSKLFNKK